MIAHAKGFQIRIRYSARYDTAHTIELCDDQARLDTRKATTRFKQAAARWCTARTVEMQRVRWYCRSLIHWLAGNAARGTKYKDRASQVHNEGPTCKLAV